MTPGIVLPALLKIQRQAEKAKYIKCLDNVMEADQNNSKVFHKLINVQRSNSMQGPEAISVDDCLIFDPQSQRIAWLDYYVDLMSGSTPTDADTNLLKALRIICRDSTPVKEFSSEEVKEAIKRLNKGKAADIDELTAEHFGNASKAFINVLHHQ